MVYLSWPLWEEEEGMQLVLDFGKNAKVRSDLGGHHFHSLLPPRVLQGLFPFRPSWLLLARTGRRDLGDERFAAFRCNETGFGTADDPRSLRNNKITSLPNPDSTLLRVLSSLRHGSLRRPRPRRRSHLNNARPSSPASGLTQTSRVSRRVTTKAR